MKILVLGGYGKVGLVAIKLLAENKLVNSITIAGRNLKKAEETAKNLGVKAEGIEIDGTSDKKLTSILKDYDLVVNAAFDDTVLPTIKAAIAAKTNYCDANIGYIEQAKMLSLQAETAGITAIIANGVSPCISNIMGIHVSLQMDDIEQMYIGRADVFNFVTGEELTPQTWQNDPMKSIKFIKEFRSYFMWLMETQQKEGLRTLKHFKEKKWLDSNPIKDGVQIPQVEGNTIKAYPFISTEDIWGTLPRDLGKSLPVMVCFSPFPPKFHDVIRKQSIAMLEGSIDAETAVNNMYEIAESDPNNYLALTDGSLNIPKMWVSVAGYKDGRAARNSCWFTAPMWNVGGYYLTSVVLALSAIKLLSGEIKVHGVIAAEDAFDTNTFFDDLAAMLPEVQSAEMLINESFEKLE